LQASVFGAGVCNLFAFNSVFRRVSTGCFRPPHIVAVHIEPFAFGRKSIFPAVWTDYGSDMQQRVTKIDPRDNVIVALAPLSKGEVIDCAGEKNELVSDVPAKHKFAEIELPPGREIIMYGVLIGRAVSLIRRGEALTTKNVRHDALPFHSATGHYVWNAPDVTRWRERTFLGYRREDGQVGTRNYWLIVPLVFCENRNLSVIKQAFEEELGYAPPPKYRRFVNQLAKLYEAGQVEKIPGAKFEVGQETGSTRKLLPNVDGIKFLVHEGGCGGTHEDSQNLCGLLAGYIHHPNVAGATVLSLGCQHAQIPILLDELKKRGGNSKKPLYIFEQQKSTSESNLISDCIRSTFSGLVEANRAARTPAALSELCVGLKCGGSDGFSGISANPALGHVADLLSTLGGRTILSEFPELCGVEQNLVDRCVSKEVADRFSHLMNEYAERAKAVRSGFEMNPSPGNIRDGLLTDAMKSAGAARKGGLSPVTAVLDYPEYSSRQGLNLQCTPGNDVECVTAQVGAGANVVLFTTGLGTPTGNPITPVIKVSTNTELATRMADIIDIDTGGIIRGERTIEQMGDELLEQVLRIASGEIHTRAEVLRQDDFIPWKRGVSL
jgi:altronate hydrolase